MKKNLIFLLLLVSGTVLAQSELSSKVDKIINPMTIKSGILHNRVNNLSGIATFGQTERKDTSDVAHLKQAYFELLGASYDNSKMLAFDRLNDRILIKNEAKILPIGVLLYDMQHVENLTDEDIFRGKIILPSPISCANPPKTLTFA